MCRLEPPSLAVFDLDDTLYDYERPNSVAQEVLVQCMSSELRIDNLTVNTSLCEARIKVKERLGATASSHSRLLYISEAFRFLNVKPNARLFVDLEEQFWGAFLKEMELFKGVTELLEELRRQRIHLALVTDLTSNIQYRKINMLGLNSIFDCIITSEEAGKDKISGLPFEILKNSFPNQPANSWFIGDSIFDYPRKDDSDDLFFKKVKRLPKPSAAKVIEFQHFGEIEALIR